MTTQFMVPGWGSGFRGDRVQGLGTRGLLAQGLWHIRLRERGLSHIGRILLEASFWR